ncbi:MAG: adenine phosphoribosyltransferase [Clostridia bacterium]|nr:adenine phosphoribosyltransferase [Clostridia bacterium]
MLFDVNRGRHQADGVVQRFPERGTKVEPVVRDRLADYSSCARDLLKKAPEYDYIITAEAKGIPLAHEIARQNNDKSYFIARKYPKLYMTGIFEVEVKSISTDKVQHLYLDVAEAEMIKGKRILIVDDVISTGESTKALRTLVEKAGGEIVGEMAILAEGDAQNREDIIFLEPLPLFRPDGTPIE